MLVALLERYTSIDAGVWLHGFKCQLPAQGTSKVNRVTSLFSVSLSVKMELTIVTPHRAVRVELMYIKHLE